MRDAKDVTNDANVVSDVAKVQEFLTPKQDVVSVAMNLRQLFVGTNKSAKVLDFWTTPTATVTPTVTPDLTSPDVTHETKDVV